jgi:potassium-transporting ATPase potassium-binding subunit
MWFLPVAIIATTVLLSIPCGFYLAWIMDGRYRAPRWLKWLEGRFDTGPQRWKQYAISLLWFNTLLFAFGFVVLALQPLLPFAPGGKGMLAPTTIFNTAISFFTNTNLQHYAGEQHFSYTSQLVFVIANMFLSASVGFCALLAVIRGLRGDADAGNFYVDLWRAVAYVFFPASLVMGVLLMARGVPMTLEPTVDVRTVEAGSMGKDDSGAVKPQSIARGPVAAVIPIKHLGTNGGGFFGANSAHPYENPDEWTNFFSCMNILIFPFSLVVMFGRMLHNLRHAAVLYSTMMVLFVALVGWAIACDTMQPNPALTARSAVVDSAGKPYVIDVQNAQGASAPSRLDVPAVVGLPVDQEQLGNLEGKELRFGTSAGATFSAVTTAVACGSVNCMHDSLNPLAGLTPLAGMWLNCIFGGKGVGMINLLIYLIVGVFLAGLMVGRTPEYLGKKVEAREMKLAMLALLVHPILILGPTGLFAACDWGTKATSNPGAHGFSEILYEFSSSSANNGSEFGGLTTAWGFNVPQQNNTPPAPYNMQWDIATGLVMLFGRLIPIVAPIALASSLAAKKRTPYTAGTLRTDTPTFGFVVFGTILLVGALLFLPAAVLGPVAEHLGPIPFGG